MTRESSSRHVNAAQRQRKSAPDVLAALDLPAWAALHALFDECPVMLANVSESHDRRRHTLNPSEFQFIADARNIAAVHEFLLSLTELLTS